MFVCVAVFVSGGVTPNRTRLSLFFKGRRNLIEEKERRKKAGVFGTVEKRRRRQSFALFCANSQKVVGSSGEWNTFVRKFAGRLWEHYYWTIDLKALWNYFRQCLVVLVVGGIVLN